MTDKKENVSDGVEVVVALGVILVTFPFAVIAKGFVLMKLWEWFLSPVVEIAAPGISYCIGLSLLAHLFVGQKRAAVKESKKKGHEIAGEFIGNEFFIPLLLLLFGYLVHLCG